MKEIILVKYGEIALKGLNKSTFEDMLQKKGHKKADHEKETKKGEKGPKKRMPFPEETKEVTQKKKVKSAPVSPPAPVPPPKKEENAQMISVGPALPCLARG